MGGAPAQALEGRHLQQLIASRSSGRTLNNAPIDPDRILEVIALAQQAPSQCNRQATRVHTYQDPARIRELLALQGGSRGFADSVGNLFVVSSEICAWGGPGQRNQAYVDGALFAMCLLLACRSMGWGACPLNLAIDHRTESAIRRVGGIPDGERLILMIAFGEPSAPDTKVAFSPRRPPAEIATLHA
jgi:nitroreductase